MELSSEQRHSYGTLVLWPYGGTFSIFITFIFISFKQSKQHERKNKALMIKITCVTKGKPKLVYYIADNVEEELNSF